MKFKVIAGLFKIRGRTYKKGEVVKSPTDLTKSFRNKFERVVDDTPETKGQSIASTPPIPTPPLSSPDKIDEKEEEGMGKGTTGVAGVEVHPKFGMDVTGEYPVAVENEMKIYQKGVSFTVIDSEDATVLKKTNKKGLVKFLAGF